MEINMQRPISDPEAEVVLRNLDKRLKAQAILSGAPVSKLLIVLPVLVAIPLEMYMLRDAVAPSLTVALLVGTFAGLIATIGQLSRVQRRLEAVIELTKLDA